MKKNFKEIEIGKKYKARNGAIYLAECASPSMPGKIRMRNQGPTATYIDVLPDGQDYKDGNSSWDMLEEIKPLILEVGKSYKVKNGKKADVVHKIDADTFVAVIDNFAYNFHVDGLDCNYGSSIVSEWPKKIVFDKWANIYPETVARGTIEITTLHSTKEQADHYATAGRIACVNIKEEFEV
jgi:hypothetical protein